MFSLFSDPMKPDSTDSLRGKQNIRKEFQDAKLNKEGKLWLMQVRGKKVVQDPSWDLSHPIPWSDPLGENQWSIWVPSDTAELENYAGYIVSCSNWKAKFIHFI